MPPITVARVTVVEVDTRLAIVAVIAMVPVVAIVRQLNNGVINGGSRTHAYWRCLGG
jgi:hypothetical protein